MTVVTPTSYLAIARANGITMLASSATWQAQLGVSTVAGGRTRIVEVTGGTPAELGVEGRAVATDGTVFTPSTVSSAWATASLPSLSSKLAGVGSFDRTGVMTFELHLAGFRPAAGEDIAGMWVRASNVMDAIRSEMEALAGSAGCFATVEIESELEPRPDDTGVDADSVIAILTLTFYA